MSGRDLTKGLGLLSRAELLEFLPENWPGLSKSLDMLARHDGIAVAIIRRLLVSARAALEADDKANARSTILELLEGAVITREAHEARVAELLAANNQLLEKAREGQRARQFLHMVATLSPVEADCDAGSLRDEARRILEPEAGSYWQKWRPRYGENEREHAAHKLRTSGLGPSRAEELVDLIAEALGLERAS